MRIVPVVANSAPSPKNMILVAVDALMSAAGQADGGGAIIAAIATTFGITHQDGIIFNLSDAWFY